MRREKRIIRISGCLLGLLLLLTACYKEDINTLYSRQYELTSELAGINGEIDRINKEIKELRDLYDALANKTPLIGFEYRVVVNDGRKDTLGIDITTDTSTFFIPFGNGKDGNDGKSPVVSISDDGYWVINGEKTKWKATSGENGGTPIISAAKDPSDPADENYYWTVKYPGDKEASFLIVDGEKVQATGPKGDKGEKGDKGDKGNPGSGGGTPVVESIIESITEAPDGSSITINLHDGSSYQIPLLGILFKLNPGDLTLKDENGLDTLLLFTREGQTIDVPYISSDNVERIESMLPAGWNATADISPTDSTKRVIHITSPKLIDLDRAQFEGGASFIAFDQKGAALTQYLKLKLKKYLYLNFFYNPLTTVETNRPTSPLNMFTFSDRERLILSLYSLESKTFTISSRYFAGAGYKDNLKSILMEYPSLIFNKKEDDVEKMYKGVVAIINTDSLDLLADSKSDTPKTIRLSTPEWEPVNPKQWILKPIPWDSYLAQFSFEMNNGSNVEAARVHRAAARWTINIAKAAELFNVPKDEFDYNKMVIRLSQQAVELFSDFTTSNRGYTEARSNTMTYDKEKDVLVCDFCSLGATSSQWSIFFYYDGVGKKSFDVSRAYGMMVKPDMHAELFLNQTIEVQRQEWKNALRVYDATSDRSQIGDNANGIRDFNTNTDLPFNP